MKRGPNLNSQDIQESGLRHLYEVALKSDAELAQHFGVSDVFVGNFRRRWGIQTITARQRRERLEGRLGPSLDHLTAGVLEDLYRRMSDRQIAKMYGVEKPAIKRLRAQWGIAPVSKSERATSMEELTLEQKEVVLGVMLGDGHLKERGVFKLSHSNAQYEYLCHVHDMLRPLSGSISYAEKVMLISGELTMSFNFETGQHVWLKAQRKIFYPEGKRVFPDAVLENLSPRSLAYWYFDDGHYESGQGPTIALGHISEEAMQRVFKQVAKRFDILVQESRTSVERCRILEVRLASADRFYHLVRGFATPDLLYKIPPKHWGSSVSSVKKYKATKEEHKLPKDLVGRLATAGEEVVEEVLKFWRGVGFPLHVPRAEHLQVLLHLREGQVFQEGVLRWNQVGQSSCQAFMPHIWKAHSRGSLSP